MQTVGREQSSNHPTVGSSIELALFQRHAVLSPHQFREHNDNSLTPSDFH
jgi:hypothetical protein